MATFVAASSTPTAGASLRQVPASLVTYTPEVSLPSLRGHPATAGKPGVSATTAVAAAGSVAVITAGRRRRKTQRERRLARQVFDSNRKYEVYPEERVVGEKDACGVGMMANMQQSPSHDLILAILRACQCMEHRGACSSGMDSNIQMCGGDDSGDGAGILTQIPWELFAQDVPLPEDKSGCAVGMMFLAKEAEKRASLKGRFERCLEKEGFSILGYRLVPTNRSVLGAASAKSEPWIEQVIVEHPSCRDDELETKLYLARRKAEIGVDMEDFYVASLSSRTVTYKGMLKSSALKDYYQDLTNPLYKIQYGLWHRRFSTNTLPKWPLAQPFRFIGHNGEINTIQGNFNAATARSATFEHPNFGHRIQEILPPLQPGTSDSGNLDNYLELMLRCNREIPEAMMITVPEAYHTDGRMETEDPLVQFYKYWGSVQEPWDGPALIAYCDGKYMGAKLDRNGLRPARYFRLRDGTTVVCSEMGIMDPELRAAGDYEYKGRLGPGQIMAIDLGSGELIENDDIKEKMAVKRPYAEWNEGFRQGISPAPFLGADHDNSLAKEVEENLLTLQFMAGYTLEDVDMVVNSMAQTGKEPTFCMGNDKPLPALSDRAHVLYDYFSQRFAQVTNPAIDPYREALVMSTSVFVGRQGNLMAEEPTQFENPALNKRLVELQSPILNENDLLSLKESGLLSVELSTCYSSEGGPRALETAVEEICYRASNAVKNGAELLVLSDMAGAQEMVKKGHGLEIGAELLRVPPLLAVGAVHHYLIEQGLRTQASLVVSTGQCWSVHHFACLIGYGASAVCPYLAFAHIRKLHAAEVAIKAKVGQTLEGTVEKWQENYRAAVDGGLRKIMSKMGISVLECYRGAQIFQCVGLSSEIVDLAFRGTPTLVQGLTMKDLAGESMMFQMKAFPELAEGKAAEKLDFAGWYKYRKNAGEYHYNNPEMAKALHQAVRNKQPLAYEEYRRQMMEGKPISTLRDLLEFHSDRQPIPVEEVEPALDICSRFCTGGMSLGALSREAHEVIAFGVNRVGGRSNSGEGGEDALRYKPLKDVDEDGDSPTFPHLKGLRNGDLGNSKTKQLASGRFGVTPAYLCSAEQLEIKVAQGAKPGEGGQLPGPKVSSYIASLRNSVAGVELISPPPHHDIYGIEDLAQLIYDLHHICPDAKVSVKLVATAGIGTVAAGVAKANADVIQISGADGGTGASPLSSIMHAGGPWEIGLSEVQHILTENGLRDRVVLRVDGGLRTGWDIVTAAMMGADEYGFGTVVMIAEGCIMARICHLNRCPVGVATQQEKLRAKFPGTPEHVANFFLFVAEEVRVILAALGYRSLEEVSGRSDLLRRRREETPRKSTPAPPPARSSESGTGGQLTEVSKTQNLDLDFLVEKASVTPEQRAWVGKALTGPAHSNGHCFEDDVLKDQDVMEVIEGNSGMVEKSYFVTNVDRSIGGRIAGAIARRYGDYGFEGSVKLNFTGAAGQSFGCWNIKGLHLKMEGDVNDYLGKGMNGGSVTVLPPQGSEFVKDRTENAIAGNTCLYGATGGQVFLSGRVGERFGVRNAGCHAVIEGSGDHLGEYMTGGVIVCIGDTGRNVGAGMSGGLIYLYDPKELVFSHELLNKDNSHNTKRIISADGEQQIRDLIQEHADRTDSPAAKRILDDWENQVGHFWQVAPASEQASRFVAPAEPDASSVLEKDSVSAMAARSRASSSTSTGSTMVDGAKSSPRSRSASLSR